MLEVLEQVIQDYWVVCWLVLLIIRATCSIINRPEEEQKPKLPDSNGIDRRTKDK